MSSRQYQEKIDELRAMLPNYEEIGVVWLKLISESYRKSLEIIYKDVLLSNEQMQNLVEIRTTKYKNSLTQEEYNIQLNELHTKSVETVIVELEKRKHQAIMTEMIQGIDVWN